MSNTVVVIGAGMGGLASAIRLAAAGHLVTVIDSAAAPGGKMRVVGSPVGPVDTGPTVLTMRHVFDALFAVNAEHLDDHLTLIPQPVLARHWWPDGSTLDLTVDQTCNYDAIRAFAGEAEAEGFLRFDRLSQRLFETFDAPMMRAAIPDRGQIARAALRAPGLWPALLPGMTLTRYLRLFFRDPRLVQLFARYATYVGGRPAQSPAVLSLIWRAEAQGVWAVQGGMHRLAQELAALATRMGVRFRFGSHATRIVKQNGRVSGVQLADGTTLPCTTCVFNGDPAALSTGLLGDGPRQSLPAHTSAPRSLSAWVWAFAATASGPRAPDLLHHNVFFTAQPDQEFGPIGKGQMPLSPTLYICAEDRARATGASAETAPERFEIILNAPAGHPATATEYAQCLSRTFPPLQSMGLTLSPAPGPEALTTPARLAQLYPGSQGAIYGRSPEGLMAAFQRPTARTALPGLYLAGGGAHPGAGVPMAALSGQHAAEAIRQDQISPARSAPMAMPGGISTASRRTDRAPSR